MKKDIKKIMNSKLMECIKLFLWGIYDICDKLIPVMLICVAIKTFSLIPKYNGYYACSLFILSIVAVISFFWDTYIIGKQFEKNEKNKKSKEKNTKKTNKKEKEKIETKVEK